MIIGTIGLSKRRIPRMVMVDFVARGRPLHRAIAIDIERECAYYFIARGREKCTKAAVQQV